MDYSDTFCRDSAATSWLGPMEAFNNPNTGEKLRTLYDTCLSGKKEQNARSKNSPIPQPSIPSIIRPNLQLDPIKQTPIIPSRSSSWPDVCVQLSCNQ